MCPKCRHYLPKNGRLAHCEANSLNPIATCSPKSLIQIVQVIFCGCCSADTNDDAGAHEAHALVGVCHGFLDVRSVVSKRAC